MSLCKLGGWFLPSCKIVLVLGKRKSLYLMAVTTDVEGRCWPAATAWSSLCGKPWKAFPGIPASSCGCGSRLPAARADWCRRVGGDDGRSGGQSPDCYLRLPELRTLPRSASPSQQCSGMASRLAPPVSNALRRKQVTRKAFPNLRYTWTKRITITHCWSGK